MSTDANKPVEHGHLDANTKYTNGEVEPILQFFAYHHLPCHLQWVSKLFGDLAHQLEATLPRNPERSVALRKLLEAKDAAVRANVFSNK